MPGLNDIPYRVYKNCPFLLKLLWKLMSHLEGICNSRLPESPSEFRRAVTSFTPKNRISATSTSSEDSLYGGKMSDQLSPGKQLHWHQLPEGRCPKIPWLCGTLSHNMGADSGMSQAWDVWPLHSLAGWRKCWCQDHTLDWHMEMHWDRLRFPIRCAYDTASCSNQYTLYGSDDNCQ